MIPAESGELASCLGRMAEPENTFLEADLESKLPQRKTILITAGPTYEAIDPVRFIGFFR
jgi:phosphopantothenoylcysteine decarboxylase/phosphopantothenate--cysteine ligase